MFVEIAVEIAEAGATLVQQVARELAPEGDADFPRDCEAAEAALTVFANRLQADCFDNPPSDFAIGEDAFNFRLQYEHAIRGTASELWRYGLRLIEEVEAELVENLFDP